MISANPRKFCLFRERHSTIVEVLEDDTQKTSSGGGLTAQTRKGMVISGGGGGGNGSGSLAQLSSSQSSIKAKLNEVDLRKLFITVTSKYNSVEVYN